MTFVTIERDETISALSRVSRYHVILTPLNKHVRTLKHVALLDCSQMEILEGYNDNGFLSTRVWLLGNDSTIKNYIELREKVQGFEFCLEHDIYTYFPSIKNAGAFNEGSIRRKWELDSFGIEFRWKEMYDVKQVKPYDAIVLDENA